MWFFNLQFPLEGLKLDLDPAILRGRTKDIIGFLNQKLKKVSARQDAFYGWKQFCKYCR